MSQAMGIRGPATGVPQVPWGIPAVLAGLALPLLMWGSGVALVIAEGTPDDLTTTEIIANLIATIIIFDGALVAAPLIIALMRYHLGWASLGFRPTDTAPVWLPLVAAAVAYVSVVLYVTVLYGFGVRAQQDVEDLFDSHAVLPLAAVATLIVAPFCEELFFRGFVFAGLIRPLGLVPAMVVSGGLFATFHIADAQSAWLVPAFAGIGVLLAWVYWRTGSLWFNIATHFLFNLVSFALLVGSR